MNLFEKRRIWSIPNSLSGRRIWVRKPIIPNKRVATIFLSLTAKSVCTDVFFEENCKFLNQTLRYSTEISNFIVCHHKLSFHITITFLFKSPRAICVYGASFVWGGGGSEVSCPNIFSIGCPKIKWFCPNITCFLGPKIAIWKFLGGCTAPQAPSRRPMPHAQCFANVSHYLSNCNLNRHYMPIFRSQNTLGRL